MHSLAQISQMGFQRGSEATGSWERCAPSAANRAGGDVGSMRERLEAPRGKVGFNGWKRQKQTHRLISTIYHMDKPVTAAVNGAAIFNYAEDR